MEHFQSPPGNGGVLPFTVCCMLNLAMGDAGHPFRNCANWINEIEVGCITEYTTTLKRLAGQVTTGI